MKIWFKEPSRTSRHKNTLNKNNALRTWLNNRLNAESRNSEKVKNRDAAQRAKEMENRRKAK